jgi:hypothetical protein
MAVKTKSEEPAEPDPFRDFSLAELWAYIHKTLGASALRSHFSDFDDEEIREVLRQYDLADIELERELLIDIADELSLLGLTKVAAVCMEEAQRRSSKFWQAGQEHKRKQWEQQPQYYLATGKRCGIIPPSILASLPTKQ